MLADPYFEALGVRKYQSYCYDYVDDCPSIPHYSEEAYTSLFFYFHSWRLQVVATVVL